MRKTIFLVLAGAWAIAILYGATTPAVPDTSARILFADKVIHFLAFSLLAALLVLSKQFKRYAPLAIAIAYGIFIEGVQSFLPFRNPDILDVVANALGAYCATVVPFAKVEEKVIAFINKANRLI